MKFIIATGAAFALLLIFSKRFNAGAERFDEWFKNLSDNNRQFLKGFYLLGAILAVVISWDRDRSILVASWHGLMSWSYVVYYALGR